MKFILIFVTAKYMRESNLTDSDIWIDGKKLKAPESRVFPTLILPVSSAGFIDKPSNHYFWCSGLASDFRIPGIPSSKPFLIREQRRDNNRPKKGIRRRCISEPENFVLKNKEKPSLVAVPESFTVVNKADPSLGVKKVQGYIDKPENLITMDEGLPSFGVKKLQSCNEELENLMTMEKCDFAMGTKKIQSYKDESEILKTMKKDEPFLSAKKVQSCSDESEKLIKIKKRNDSLDVKGAPDNIDQQENLITTGEGDRVQSKIDESEKLLAMEKGESSLDVKKMQSYIDKPKSLITTDEGEPSSSKKMVQSYIDESEILTKMEKSDSVLDIRKLQGCIDESDTLMTKERNEPSLDVKRVQSYIDEPENFTTLVNGEFSSKANKVEDATIFSDTSTLEREQQILNTGAKDETKSNNIQLCAQKRRESSKSRGMTSQSFSTDTKNLTKDGLASKNEATIIVENSFHEKNKSNKYRKVATVDNRMLLCRRYSIKSPASSKNALAEQDNPSRIDKVSSAQICRESDTNDTNIEKFTSLKLKENVATHEKKCTKCFQETAKSDYSQNCAVHCVKDVDTERRTDEVVTECVDNQEEEMIPMHGNLDSSSFMQNMTEGQKNGNCCITVGDISLHFGENDIVKLHKKVQRTNFKEETIELQKKIEELLDRFHVNSTMVGRTGNIRGVTGEGVAKVDEELMSELKKVLIEANDMKLLAEQWKNKWLELDNKLRETEEDNNVHKAQYQSLVDKKEELEAALSAANEKRKYFEDELNRRNTELLCGEENIKLLESRLKEKEQALEEMVDFDAKEWQEVCKSTTVKKEDNEDEITEDSSISHNFGILSCFLHLIRRIKRKRKGEIKMKMLNLTIDELDEEISDLRKKLSTEKRKCALLVLLKEEKVCELELYKEKTTTDATTLENVRRELEIANSTWQKERSHKDVVVRKLSKEYSMLSQQSEYCSMEMIGLKDELREAAWNLKFADSYNAEMEERLKNYICLLRKRVEKEKKEHEKDKKLFSFKLEEKDRQLGVLKAELNAERKEHKNLMTRCKS